MFVKICGLTNLEDTLAAVDCGAQALGFNFVPASPRYIETETLARWIERIPPHIWKVGVYMNEAPGKIARHAGSLGLDIAQLHGSETPAAVPENVRVWKAARVTPGFDAASLDLFDVEAVLLDGPSSGVGFDWSLALGQRRKLILAGGLDAGNVRDAVARVQPWGVDVCSRIEISPGRKDHPSMRRFMEAALSC